MCPTHLLRASIVNVAVTASPVGLPLDGFYWGTKNGFWTLHQFLFIIWNYQKTTRSIDQSNFSMCSELSTGSGIHNETTSQWWLKKNREGLQMQRKKAQWCHSQSNCALHFFIFYLITLWNVWESHCRHSFEQRNA